MNKPHLSVVNPSAQGNEAVPTGFEAGMGDDQHQSLRLWLRLLACTTEIETTIRQRLRQEFGMTLPRFDYLAQLHRHPEGMRMNELTRNLMVTGGNVTALTDELEKAGFVTRTAQAHDRRATVIAMTAAGRQQFETMAAVHEKWVVQLFAGMPDGGREHLYQLLGQLRKQLAPEPDGP